MRDYSKVSPKFWIGATGKRMRAAGMEAQIVAMYLLTSPHANMLGLYYCPEMFIAHETGLGMEGASKGLRSAIEAGFCEYDEASEVVWVIEMASYQIADSLKPADLRVKGVHNEYMSLPSNPYLARFFEKYKDAFCMTESRELINPPQAPSKPLASQEQEQEQKKEQEQEQREAAEAGGNPSNPEGLPAENDPPAAAQPAPRASSPRGSRLPSDWKLPKLWGEWALEDQPDWDADRVRLEADKFRDYWVPKTGKDATKLDWLGTWRNWVRRAAESRPARGRAGTGGSSAFDQSMKAAEEAKKMIFGESHAA
ncbi:DNA-binding protein [Pusillimonas noertemannii]|uniref:Uncharacterized protein n=1 Tax=Pusillimonas noertemannii TaxID=305977 RepID=A0A2U1CMF0_9BURK|nr:DNA-binding protein [Pusillimonas noertemannii]NYT68781.1 DNA-binding protein [Pusillimonas noertemannii]PVY62196.1 hypothetical protein C7440_1689 [Pusillimonas noertemannii]